MVRRLLMVALLAAVGVAVGCEGDKSTNKEKLEYNKEPPPQRDKVAPPKT